MNGVIMMQKLQCESHLIELEIEVFPSIQKAKLTCIIHFRIFASGIDELFFFAVFIC